MSTPAAVPQGVKLSKTHQLVLFVLLCVCGLLVFLVGGYLATIPKSTRTVIKVGLPLLFLGVTVILYRSERFKAYWQIACAFCVASVGFLVAWFLSSWLLAMMNTSITTMAGLAIAKFVDSFLIVAPIIVLIKITGSDMGTLYLQRGNLKLGLLIGGITFTAFAILFFLQAQDQGIGMGQIVAWIPWILIFVLSNAFMEELHFRGLFLRKLEPFLGRGFANLAVAIVFTLAHAPVEYTPDIIQFLAILFFLALAWGYVIQKTDSLWGSVLFHAGADLLIIVGILQSFGGMQ